MKCTNRQTISLVNGVVLLLGAAACALPAVKPCLQVASGEITAGMLQERVPEMRAIPSALAVGRAPVAGIVRVIPVRELNAILRKYAVGSGVSITNPSTSVCVERQASRIPPSTATEAIRLAFGAAGRTVRVEVLAQSEQPVSAGSLHFALSALPRATDPSAPVVWRGWHVSEDGVRTAIWARVKLAESVAVEVSGRDLAAGSTIAVKDLSRIERVEFPAPGPQVIWSPAGMVLRHAVRAGSRIGPGDVESPMLIQRGETVALEVAQGFVRLAFTGQAQTAGRAGQRVAVTGPFSKRSVQAVVQEKGRALVQIPEFPRCVAAGGK